MILCLDTWQAREKVLSAKGIILEDAKTDLIDEIWTQDQGRPEKPNFNIMIHDILFAGKTWNEKINEVKERMAQVSADIFVVTALDEVAWLLNLRGADVPNNPFFFAYAIVSANGPHTLYIDLNRLNDELREHLNGIQFKEYTSVESDIQAASEAGRTVWVSPMSSYSIYNAVTNKVARYF